MARGQLRIRHTDLEYGLSCPLCASPKTKQAKLCRSCDTERLRDGRFWTQRTCECGGPKARSAQRCAHCANERRVGVPRAGLAQVASHPWKRARDSFLRERAA